MKLQNWQTLKSKIVFSNRWVRLRQDRIRLPNGSVISDYFVRETNRVAVIFALTKDRKVITIHQYRHGIGEVVNNLPSGNIEPSEQPLASAKRELLEETGYRAGKIRKIGEAYAEPTGSNARVIYFLAEDCKKVAEPLDNPREEIEVELVSINELKRRAAHSKIRCQYCLSAILLGLLVLKNNLTTSQL